MISDFWIITIISLSNIEQSFLCLLLFGEKKNEAKFRKIFNNIERRDGRKIPCPSSDFAGRRTQKTFKFYLNKISFSLHVNSQSGLRFMWQPISSSSCMEAASYKKAPQTRKNPLIKKHDFQFWILCDIILCIQSTLRHVTFLYNVL